MQFWVRDQTGRLVRNTFDSTILSQINSQIGTMADNESMHNENQTFKNQENRGMTTLREYLQPTRTSTPSCMIFPTNVGHFDIKPGVIQLLPKFHGLDSESPYLHLKEFEEVCATLHTQNISDDTIRLKLLSFSLKEKVKTWLNYL